MSKKTFRGNAVVVNNLVNLLLLIVASILFAVIFPNNIFPKGAGFLASVALVPLAILLQRIRMYTSPIWGFLYGFSAYYLFNIWLGKFSPVAFLIVPPIYGIYFMLIFLVLKIIPKYFSKYSFLVQAMVWVVYEYLRTQGFLGYSFGILGYSWAFYPVLIQNADIFGVWGITFFIAISSFFIAQLYRDYCLLPHKSARCREKFVAFVRGGGDYKKFLIIYVAVFVGIMGYGVLSPKQYKDSKTVRMALVQHASDPWKGGYIAYKTSLDILTQETKEILESDNPPDMVIWSETAFVPSMTYHLKYREVPAYARLVKELYSFLEQYPDTEFLIGNGEGVKVKNNEGKLIRKNYNATLFFKGGEKLAHYYKIHLVPFTEYFPYETRMPRFYEFLKQNDVHFWLKGDEYTVFKGDHVSFATPICFEDGFGQQNAKFVKDGAEILINVTNDAWSYVETNAMQHLQLSIMRAVENRRSMVRGTNSGMTAVISPNGKILEMLPSFTIDTLVRDVHIYTKSNTIYTKLGDWFMYVMAGAVLACVGVAFFRTRKRE